jgi:3-hydroxybutyryl-CoA dehydratase
MNELGGHDLEDLEIGMSANYAKTLTEADVILFAGATGDVNAVHINEEYAATTPFGGRVVHGFLTAGLISAAIANKLPGPGTIYLGQSMRCKAPVKPGDTVNVEVTVKEVIAEKRRVVMKTDCYVGDTQVIEGEARVLVTSAADRAAAAGT